MIIRWPFIEIERKFIVRSDAWHAQSCRSAAIRQSYLPAVAGITVRVRQSDGRFRLTYKTERIGISRGEVEIAILPVHAAWLFSLCPYPAIEKQRHHVIDQGRVWHVDVFLGRHDGLVIAEVELDHPSQSFPLPDWVGEEVSLDRRFSNSNLYREKFPPDSLPTAL